MQLNQVLVVYKQLTTTPYGKKGGRELHLKTLDELYELLKELGIPFDAQSARQLRKIPDVDLVITVGGDGTVLATSHFVSTQPILGIKSFGRESVGFFCAATHDTMRRYLTDLLKERYRPKRLHRLEVIIDGHLVAERALNDVLVAHAMPASTSRYKIEVGKLSEEQKSSGVWISTAAGSTAAIKAAGGKILPLGSNRIQYIIREPYSPTGRYHLLGGVLPKGAAVKVTSYMSQGTVSIDGSSIQYPAPQGTKIVVTSAKEPVWVFWR